MDVQPEVIRSQLADSLARLGTDYVDLYYQVGLLLLFACTRRRAVVISVGVRVDI